MDVFKRNNYKEILPRVILIVSIILNLVMYGLYEMNAYVGSVGNYIIFALCIIFLFLNYKIIIRDIKANLISKIIFIFLLFNLITIFVNIDIISNLKLFIITIVQTMIIFQYSRCDKAFLKSVMNFFLITLFVFSFVSLILYFLNIHISLYSNRYCGIYSNPNIGSAVSSIALAFSFIMLNYCRSKHIKFFHIANIITQFLMIRLCDSRASMLFLFCFFFFYILGYFLCKIRKPIYPILLTVLFCLTMNIIYTKSSALLEGIKTQIYIVNNQEEIANEIEIEKPSTENPTSEIKPVEEKKPETSIKIESIGRDEELESQSTSYRFALIENGIRTGMQKPLFGFGIFNVPDAIERNSTEYLDGLHGGGTHNTYVELFVSNGLLGLLTFIVIISYIGVMIVKKILPLSKRNNIFMIKDMMMIGCISLFISFLLYGMFEANLILSSSIITSMFWMICGGICYEEEAH